MSTQTATPTTREPVTHTVRVGEAGYTILPPSTLAEVGDYIEYLLYPKNHSIVRADFDYPCIPYEMINTSPGFYSGFRPVDTVRDPSSFIKRVNDSEPIFTYCSGPEACDKHGMVHVVNPNSSTSLDVHRQKAMQVAYVLQPGDSWPAEGSNAAGDQNGGHSSTSATLHATITITPTPTSPATSTTSTAVSSNQSSLSTGAIAGIAIGAAAIALIAGIAIWICGRRSRGRRGPEDNSGTWLNGFGSKQNPFQSGTTTPATMPPAYGPHGVPVMIQANKGYPGSDVNTSIIEHYRPSAGSPPIHMSPNYMEQSFPPYLLNPATSNQNLYGLQHQPTQQHYHTSEIYSGTPAPRSPPPMQASFMPGTATVADNRQSTTVSHSTHSRGGSPDINEMNVMSRSPGTINQGGGAMPDMQEPVPRRSGLGVHINRLGHSG